MFGKFVVIFILVLSLSSCSAKPKEWYTNYGIPDRYSLSQIESIPKLINALDDEDPEIRANAAEVLGTFGPKANKAVDKLYSLRIQDKSGTVRLFAHYALKEIFQGEYDGLYLKKEK